MTALPERVKYAKSMLRSFAALAIMLAANI
jgi:hypothetical protein